MDTLRDRQEGYSKKAERGAGKRSERLYAEGGEA